jgi:hypothetical protein
MITSFFVDLKNGPMAKAARHVVHLFIALLFCNLMWEDVTAIKQITWHKMPIVRLNTDIATYADLSPWSPPFRAVLLKRVGFSALEFR